MYFNRTSIRNANLVKRCFFCLTGSILFALVLILALPSVPYAAQISLAWDSSSGEVAGYRMYSRTDGEGYDYTQPCWEGTTTACSLDADASVATYFVVRAYDTQGLESADSNEVVLTGTGAASLSGSGSADGGGGGGGCFIHSIFN